jgi:hypothetical protein
MFHIIWWLALEFLHRYCLAIAVKGQIWRWLSWNVGWGCLSQFVEAFLWPSAAIDGNPYGHSGMWASQQSVCSKGCERPFPAAHKKPVRHSENSKDNGNKNVDVSCIVIGGVVGIET